MALRSSHIVGVGLVALALTAGLGLSALTRPAGGETHILPDGTALTLEGVTYGATHRWVSGSQLQRLGSGLPPAFARLIGNPPVSGCQTAPTELMLWFSGKSPLLLSSQTKAVLVDGAGREGYKAFIAFTNLQLDRTIIGLRAPSFPRRERSFRVRVYRETRGTGPSPLLGEYRVTNPAPMPSPADPTERRSVTASGCEFRLTRLQTALAIDNPMVPAPKAEPGERIWTRLQYEVRRNGRPTAGWVPDEVTVTNDAGDKAEYQARAGGPGFVAFENGLWPDEPWNIHIGFKSLGVDRPATVWDCPELPMPAPGRLSPSGAAVQRDGIPIKFLGLAGANARFPGSPLGRSTPYALFEISRTQPDVNVELFRAADGDGKQLTTISSTLESMDNRAYLVLDLASVVKAKRLRLQVGVRRSVSVDFRAKPEWGGGPTPARSPAGAAPGTAPR
jgi:hypothetical protein